MRRTLAALPLVLLCACNMDPDPALEFFPAQDRFETGYANKLYTHFKPYNKDQESMTRISYATYQLINKDLITVKNYNAGFELRGWQYYHLDNGNMHLDSSWYMQGSDTVKARIESGVMKNFADSSGSFYRENYEYENQEHQYISNQYLAHDTLIDNRVAKHFHFSRSYRNLDTDSTEQVWEARETYLNGIGFLHSWEASLYGDYETELMEQMPLSEFEKRAAHGEHRVAWIDPKTNLGGHPNFKLCGPEEEIADYYNGEPDAEYLYGKKAMVHHLESSIDSLKLEGMEGMITFRFVISCEGLAGRFICQAYDFDYQKIDIPEVSKEHLLKNLKDLETWQPTVIRGEKRDAYAYITFKIKDESIIDILP